MLTTLPRLPVSRALIAVLACVMFTAAARAQLGQVEPYYAAISGAEATLRSGAQPNFYSVGRARAGQIVRVDAEGGGWARVTYPSGLTAYVPAGDVTVDAAGKTAVLNKASKLKAANADTGGPIGSWKSLLDQPVPPGTKLTLAAATPVDDGRGNLFFRVAPPEGARAFVQVTNLRRATPEEIAAFTGAETPAAPAGPGPVTIANPSGPTTSTGETPADSAAATPEVPVVISQEPVVEQPSDPMVDRITKLESAFEAVRKQPAADAEFGELIAEYERTIAEQSDTPEGAALRARLEQRVAVLRIKADIQEELRKIADARSALSEEQKAFSARMTELERARQYAIVGRLSASTIYNGERLPLMFRVQSVGGMSPRTLGYIKPEEALNLEAKLGQIVGVVGDPVEESGLRLNIIDPRRVDVLEPMQASAPEESGPNP